MCDVFFPLHLGWCPVCLCRCVCGVCVCVCAGGGGGGGGAHALHLSTSVLRQFFFPGPNGVGVNRNKVNPPPTAPSKTALKILRLRGHELCDRDASGPASIELDRIRADANICLVQPMKFSSKKLYTELAAILGDMPIQNTHTHTHTRDAELNKVLLSRQNLTQHTTEGLNMSIYIYVSIYIYYLNQQTTQFDRLATQGV